MKLKISYHGSFGKKNYFQVRVSDEKGMTRVYEHDLYPLTNALSKQMNKRIYDNAEKEKILMIKEFKEGQWDHPKYANLVV